MANVFTTPGRNRYSCHEAAFPLFIAVEAVCRGQITALFSATAPAANLELPGVRRGCLFPVPEALFFRGFAQGPVNKAAKFKDKCFFQLQPTPQ